MDCKDKFVYIYTMSAKKIANIFAANFAKCLPIFRIVSPTDLAVNVQKSDDKNISPPLKYVATLPCEMSVLKKWPCSR